MTDTIKLTVDGIEVNVARGSTVMDACKVAEQEVPHFCYHERLSIAGNCRMCLVELEGAPKPVASCAWPAAEGMVVKTQSAVAKQARQGTMELLLINHPLDCPECDKGGECTLQDLAVAYGSDCSRFKEEKRVVAEKELGAKIKTAMTRCIHCMRCVRFATEIAGVEDMGATGRGEHTEVGPYVEKALLSELAGNMIDICPVGALNNKPYSFTARPWELQATETIDVNDAVGSHIRIDSRAGEIMRIVPTECDDINEEWLADHARFAQGGLQTNRITTPMGRAKKDTALHEVSWKGAFDKIKTSLSASKISNIAGVYGKLHGAEDLYSFNALLKQTIGTPHIDGCSNHAPALNSKRSLNIMNTPIADVEKSDLIVLVGCNPRYEAPLVNTRIRKAVKNGAKVYSFGTAEDLTYNVEMVGTAAADVSVSLKPATKLGKAVKAANNPVIIIGDSAVQVKDSADLITYTATMAEKLGVVKDGWNGFNVLPSFTSQIASIDMGATPGENGRDFKEIIKAASAGKLDVLFIYGEVEGLTAEVLEKSSLTVYIGTHKTALAKACDIMLPSSTYAEKAQLWPNVEGRVQQGFKAVMAPQNAKEDWKIFRALSEHLGAALEFDTLEQLRTKIAEQNNFYAPENYGKRLASEWEKLVSNDAPASTKAFAPYAHSFYLNNEITSASEPCKQCQAELDSNLNNNIKKIA